MKTPLWLLLLCISGALARRSFVSHPPVPNSCARDDECPFGEVCSRDGICSPLGEYELPPRPLLSVGVVVAIAVLCSTVACVVLVAFGCHTSGIPLREEWGERDTAAAVAVVCLSSLACSLLAVFIGVPLGLSTQETTLPRVRAGNCSYLQDMSCEPYFCDVRSEQCFSQCSYDVECRDPTRCEDGLCVGQHYSEPLLGPGLVVLVALSPAIVCGLLICLSAKENARPAAACCGVLCCMFLALVLGLSLGLSTRDVETAPAHSSPGSACNGSAPCVPYLCDMGSRTCETACRSNAHCTEPWGCESGECVLPNSGILSKPSIFAVIAISFVAGAVLAGCAAGICGALGPQRDDPVPAGVACVCTCIVVVLLVAIPLGVSTRPLYHGVTGNGTECAALQAVVCEPYFCDLQNGACFETCTQDAECVDSTMCENGRCVSSNDSLERPRVPPWAAATAAVLAGVLTCCVSLLAARSLLPVDNWNLPLMTIFEDLMDDNKGPHLFVAVVGSAMCCLLVGVSVGLLGLLHADDSILDDSLLPGSNHTNTTCVGTMAGVCGWHYCNSPEGVCQIGCLSDANCKPGSSCQNATCAETPLMAPLPTPWAVYVVVIAGVASCACMLLVTGKLAGCSCRRRMMYGIALEYTPFMGCAGLCCCLAVAAVVATAMATVTITVPLDPGVGPACSVLRDWRCEPYYCDLHERKCVVNCTDDWDCVPGSVCSDEGTCVKSPTTLPFVIAGTLAFSVAVVAIVAGLPSVIRWRQDRDMQYERLVRQEFVREQEEREALRDEVRRTHPVILDIKPANPTAKDPTVPAPAVWDRISHSEVSPRPEVDLGGDHTFEFPSVSLSDDVDEITTERAAKAEEEYMIEWQCETCTCVNAMTTMKCAACGRQAPLTILNRPEAQSLIMEWECFTCTVVNPATTAECQGCYAPAPAYVATFSDVLHWNCHACTYRNSEDLKWCGMCSTARKRRVKPSLTIEIPDAPFARVDVNADNYCVICYTDYPTVIMSDEGTCDHGFCDDCAVEALSTILNTAQFPARCPGCRADHPNETTSCIPAAVVERMASRGILTGAFSERFIQQQLVRAFPPHELTTCPVCTVICVSARSSLEKEASHEEDVFRAQCLNCMSKFCTRCSVLYRGHEGITCEVFAKKQRGDDKADMMTDSLIDSTAKRCPNCNMAISHYKGHACHHIRPGTGCPSCGIHFCIVCLRRVPCGESDHGMYCDDRCDCPPCPDCRYGDPCEHCEGDSTCPVCAGRIGRDRPPRLR